MPRPRDGRTCAWRSPAHCLPSVPRPSPRLTTRRAAPPTLARSDARSLGVGVDPGRDLVLDARLDAALGRADVTARDADEQLLARLLVAAGELLALRQGLDDRLAGLLVLDRLARAIDQRDLGDRDHGGRLLDAAVQVGDHPVGDLLVGALLRISIGL